MFFVIYVWDRSSFLGHCVTNFCFGELNFWLAGAANLSTGEVNFVVGERIKSLESGLQFGVLENGVVEVINSGQLFGVLLLVKTVKSPCK